MFAPSVSRMLVALACSGALFSSCGASPIAPEMADASDQSRPAMLTITPASGPVGTQVTITGTGFQTRDNHLKFGQGYIKDLTSADGTVLRFTIPDGLDLCAPAGAGPCAGGYPQTLPGDYKIEIINGAGAAEAMTFTVTRP